MAEQPTSHCNTEQPLVYPENDSKATPALESILEQEIQESGPIAFSQFMEMALYHPELGYYSSSQQKTGKQGDFITSVSVGRCFGTILAARLHDYWLSSGKPKPFAIIEPGAHDGSLAEDILHASSARHPEFYQAIHYLLVERTQELTDLQKRKLDTSHAEKYSQHSSLDDICEAHGAVISNELIDAFPVELIRFDGSTWHILYVTLNSDSEFCLVPQTISDPTLKNFCDELGTEYPAGYTTEFNTGLANYITTAASSIKQGLVITIDYGHTHDDYYHPDRLTGTLQTYQAHQKSDNPLASPGKYDITAHVDFSRLQQAASSAGLHSPWFGTQASYLTQHARSWLLEMEVNAKTSNKSLIKQFQTLTHPSMLGTRFSVLEMQK